MDKPTLAELRTQHKLTQQDLADMSGVLKVAIGKHETGVRALTVRAQGRIAAALNVGVEDIEWGSTPKATPSVTFEVRGHTGERDDAQSWVAGTFRSREPADAAVRRAERWLDEHFMRWGGAVIAPWADRDAAAPPFDKHFVCDYTGVRYEVVPVVRGC